MFSGYSPTKPDVDKLRETIADGPDENSAHREDSHPRHSSTFRDELSSPSKAKHLLEQENVPDIPLQGGNISTRDTSATPPRLQYYSRRGRSIGMNQRRLAFESSSDSKQKAVARTVGSDSIDASASTVEFKGRTKSAVSILPKMH